jgi:hypothetical protein
MLRDFYSDQLACVAQGNASVAPIDANISNLDQTWNPSGYYTPDAIRQAIASVQAVMSSALTTWDQGQLSCTEAPGCSWPATSDYDGVAKLLLQIQNYTGAADAAQASAAAVLATPYVVAPGFKKWALDSLTAASSMLVTASVVACNMPWWAAAISDAFSAVAAAATVLGNILGVAADIVNAAYKTGKAVLTVAAESFDLLAWVSSNFPYIISGVVLLLGGRFVWKNRHELKARLKLPHRGTSGSM